MVKRKAEALQTGFPATRRHANTAMLQRGMGGFALQQDTYMCCRWPAMAKT